MEKSPEEQCTVKFVYAEVNFKIEIKTFCIVLKKPLLKNFLLVFQHVMTLQT